MFFYTDTADAPWTVIKSNDKKRARIECMRHFLHHIDYPDKDPAVAIPPDPRVVGSAEQAMARGNRILGTAMHPESRHVREMAPTGPDSAVTAESV
jgi:hypothetical protein